MSSVMPAISPVVKNDPTSKKTPLFSQSRTNHFQNVDPLYQVLNIPDVLMHLTDIIKEEVGAQWVLSATLTRTRSFSIDSTILVSTNVINLCVKKKRKRVKVLFTPQRIERRKKAGKAETKDVKYAPGGDDVDSSLIKEWKETLRTILDVVPDYKEIFSETATGIQPLSKDIDRFINRKKRRILYIFVETGWYISLPSVFSKSGLLGRPAEETTPRA